MIVYVCILANIFIPSCGAVCISISLLTAFFCVCFEFARMCSVSCGLVECVPQLLQVWFLLEVFLTYCVWHNS
jgi:hypothetical protein